MQIDAANGQQMGECLASLLTSIPRIPDEVFAYAVCSSAGYANQQQVNDCTVVVMDAIRRKKGLLLAESCVVLFALASSYAPAGSSAVFEEVIGEAVESDRVLECMVAVCDAMLSGASASQESGASQSHESDASETTQSSPTSETSHTSRTLTRLSHFTNGILILSQSDDVRMEGTVKKSGRFQMVSEEVSVKESLVHRQQRCLEGLRAIDMSYVLLCACSASATASRVGKKHLEHLEWMMHYFEERKDGAAQQAMVAVESERDA